MNISDNVKVTVNAEKIAEDAQWDGLKGYLTNTDLAADVVYEQYHDLWVIERAYRITSGTPEMRPIFHLLLKELKRMSAFVLLLTGFTRNLKEYCLKTISI